MDVVLDNLDVFARGMRTTVSLTVLSFAVALVIGIVVAACRVSPVPPLRWVGVDLRRAGPQHAAPVLFVLFFFGLTKVGIQYDAFTTAIIVLGGYTGAFVGGDGPLGDQRGRAGQAEAARSLGLTFPQVLRPRRAAPGAAHRRRPTRRAVHRARSRTARSPRSSASLELGLQDRAPDQRHRPRDPRVPRGRASPTSLSRSRRASLIEALDRRVAIRR